MTHQNSQFRCAVSFTQFAPGQYLSRNTCRHIEKFERKGHHSFSYDRIFVSIFYFRKKLWMQNSGSVRNAFPEIPSKITDFGRDYGCCKTDSYAPKTKTKNFLVLTETQNCQPEPNPEMKNTLKLPMCHLITIGTAQLL